MWEGVARPLVEAETVEIKIPARKLREMLGRSPEGPLANGLRETLQSELEDTLVIRPGEILASGPQEANLSFKVVTKSFRAVDPQTFPVVSTGQPEIWRLPDLYPPQQVPRLMQAQLQAADFYLIRLFCSFRPVPGRARVGWARFHVFLQPDSLGRQPIAYDISPICVG